MSGSEAQQPTNEAQHLTSPTPTPPPARAPNSDEASVVSAGRHQGSSRGRPEISTSTSTSGAATEAPMSASHAPGQPVQHPYDPAAQPALAPHVPPVVPPIVAPSDFLGVGLRRTTPVRHAVSPIIAHLHPKGSMEQPKAPLSVIDREQIEGLRAIRAFLKVRTSYDVLPLSFRLIVFDTALLVKKSLNILIQNGIVSAPLWDSKTSTFAGLLTTSDYINVIQYYWQNPDQLHLIDQFTLNSLRDIEKAIGAPQIETVSIHPERPLYEACRMMVTSRARRIPLVDIDDETKRAMVVSVVTQYRILKFVAVNVKETQKLKKPLKELKIGTYEGIATASMETPVIDVIHILFEKNISSVPILDKEGAVINVFEAVDVIALIKGGVYDELNLTVGEALLKRSDDFAGIYTCSMWDRLDTIFDTIRRSRVHRLVVIDENARLQGVLTLSDILEYVLLEGADQEDRPLE
ncbi:uncharacterized protein PV09_05302 [Verruconis gallopava]|uniref:CBS domain-containing protein n=1 Tax=Verruconis gallopava TaxID=253628 RepID=A0A0D1XM83_9PEZI|nr:uncharacterized protein PV09_05302 [Verruconis gallopava]KIW03541.1 hypothetical protein PV09_05302 [Verruconis gallopava]